MHRAILILVLTLPTAALGQSIGPISQDFGHGKANGSVTITNQQLTPLAVSLSSFQFVVKDGQKQTITTEPGVSVKLAQTSLKIPPKQSRILDAEVICPQGCNVEISAAMLSPGMRTPSGVQIRLILGSIFYVAPANESGKDRRKKVLIAGNVKP